MTDDQNSITSAMLSTEGGSRTKAPDTAADNPSSAESGKTVRPKRVRSPRPKKKPAAKKADSDPAPVQAEIPTEVQQAPESKEVARQQPELRPEEPTANTPVVTAEVSALNEESAAAPESTVASEAAAPERHWHSNRRDRPSRHPNDQQQARPPRPPEPLVFAEGIVEVSGKGFGFLREPKRNFTQSNNDVFVTPEVIRKYGLRDGMWIRGETRRGPRGPQLYKLTELEREDPDLHQNLPVFEELTTVSPDRRIVLETDPNIYTTRIIDLVSPVGRGQRGLIVAPPRTGKTTLLQHIAAAVVRNHKDIHLIILLVDERPEEVTEIRRTVPSAEVMASSNDCDVKTHTRISQLAIERAKRLVEMGKDVFVLMDSLTRMGRAFNNAQGGGGRTMSGGVDSRALEIPRKLFAAARNTEEAGSLTIMATALIETNSRMDDLIFQEFKGTGNMELVLDRKISEQRIYPAVDIFQSGTRREELLLTPEELHKINVIRRGLAGHKPMEAIERLLFFIRKYPTNAEMLSSIPG
jgi:transcription termination factor Rho